MKKVAIIGTAGIPACYGGFETLTENLTKYNSGEISYTVFCSEKIYSKKLDKHNNANLEYISFSPNGASSILYDIVSLLRVRKYDVVLILGVSGCIMLPFFKLISRTKVITNIDGIEWRRDKWGKLAKWFLKLSEKIAVKYSDLVVTDNDAITEYVKNEYNVHSQTIAYGGDHVLVCNAIHNNSIMQKDFFLALCRIEPENNVEMILKAFSQTNKKLIFLGNWNSSQFGIKMRQRFSEFANINFLDPIYDINVLHGLRKNCIAYVHGHSAGGTNPSLVEAMHFKKHIFAYDCNFNRCTTENKADFFTSEEQLILLLQDYDHQSKRLNDSDMKEIADRRYTWKIVTKQYEDLYDL
ncbi:DUF1972 domain-containing protein [Xenorhabdus khoisanae]|uniref:DUF1972 domain-containing protein n=1 Tax=Xenorhabdus khoisanae TaxID=880157 RepID=UPI0032B7C9AF